jgi:single-strand DNA-binding protein
MSSLNKAMIIGNVGKDPEIRTMQSGGKVANLSVATSEKWTDKHTGEKKEKTEWHRITIFNEGLVTLVESYVKKGNKIYIEGSIETRKWQDQQGNDRYSTDIVLKAFNGKIVLLSNRNDGVQDGNRNDSYQKEPVTAINGSQIGASSEPDMMDDEIPF